MMQPPRPQSRLDDLEPPPQPGFAAYDPVFHADDCIVVYHLAVAFGRVVVPEYSQGSDHFQARVGSRDEDERVAFVRGGVGGVGYGEDDVDCVAGVAGARDPLYGQNGHWRW